MTNIMHETTFTKLISPRQLRQLAEDCVIFDCRFNLSAPLWGLETFRQSRIPGASYLNLEKDLSAAVTAGSGRHPLPRPERFLQRLKGCGFDPAETPDAQVVVYDDAGGAMAARAWWLLRLLGHEAVAVLDGGIQAWQIAGYEIEKEEPGTPHDADSISPEPEPKRQARYIEDRIVEQQEVLVNCSSRKYLLVDARAPERFRGESEPIDPVAGHIPGAVNRPLTLNLHMGRFKTADELRREWHILLAGKPAEAVIHMCGSGVTACHNLLSMEIAGLSGSRLYAGSWSEWIQNPRHPTEPPRDS